jgi:phosphoribosylaminoimidazole-succinocarboxamide synthase
VLTALSVWWFQQLAPVLAEHGATHHLLAAGPALADEGVPAELTGRSMLVRRLEMLPVECVARGYLSGSGTAEYQRTGAIVDVALPAGLVEGSRLPEPVFTPSTKAAVGEHDEPIPFTGVIEAVGAEQAEALRSLTLALYRRGAQIAEDAGIVLADTKFEFGTAAGAALVLGDEVLTPDSSRFWPATTWSPGAAQPSYDKQFVRDWLTVSGWDRVSEPPELPEQVVAATRDRYVRAYEQLTGTGFA